MEDTLQNKERLQSHDDNSQDVPSFKQMLQDKCRENKRQKEKSQDSPELFNKQIVERNKRFGVNAATESQNPSNVVMQSSVKESEEKESYIDSSIKSGYSEGNITSINDETMFQGYDEFLKKYGQKKSEEETEKGSSNIDSIFKNDEMTILNDKSFNPFEQHFTELKKSNFYLKKNKNVSSQNNSFINTTNMLLANEENFLSNKSPTLKRHFENSNSSKNDVNFVKNIKRKKLEGKGEEVNQASFLSNVKLLDTPVHISSNIRKSRDNITSCESDISLSNDTKTSESKVHLNINRVTCNNQFDQPIVSTFQNLAQTPRFISTLSDEKNRLFTMPVSISLDRIQMFLKMFSGSKRNRENLIERSTRPETMRKYTKSRRYVSPKIRRPLKREVPNKRIRAMFRRLFGPILTDSEDEEEYKILTTRYQISEEESAVSSDDEVKTSRSPNVVEINEQTIEDTFKITELSDDNSKMRTSEVTSVEKKLLRNDFMAIGAKDAITRNDAGCSTVRTDTKENINKIYKEILYLDLHENISIYLLPKKHSRNLRKTKSEPIINFAEYVKVDENEGNGANDELNEIKSSILADTVIYDYSTSSNLESSVTSKKRDNCEISNNINNSLIMSDNNITDDARSDTTVEDDSAITSEKNTRKKSKSSVNQYFSVMMSGNESDENVDFTQRTIDVSEDNNNEIQVDMRVKYKGKSQGTKFLVTIPSSSVDKFNININDSEILRKFGEFFRTILGISNERNTNSDRNSEILERQLIPQQCISDFGGANKKQDNESTAHLQQQEQKDSEDVTSLNNDRDSTGPATSASSQLISTLPPQNTNTNHTTTAASHTLCYICKRFCLDNTTIYIPPNLNGQELMDMKKVLKNIGIRCMQSRMLRQEMNSIQRKARQDEYLMNMEQMREELNNLSTLLSMKEPLDVVNYICYELNRSMLKNHPLSSRDCLTLLISFFLPSSSKNDPSESHLLENNDDIPRMPSSNPSPSNTRVSNAQLSGGSQHSGNVSNVQSMQQWNTVTSNNWQQVSNLRDPPPYPGHDAPTNITRQCRAQFNTVNVPPILNSTALTCNFNQYLPSTSNVAISRAHASFTSTSNTINQQFQPNLSVTKYTTPSNVSNVKIRTPEFTTNIQQNMSMFPTADNRQTVGATNMISGTISDKGNLPITEMEWKMYWLNVVKNQTNSRQRIYPSPNINQNAFVNTPLNVQQMRNGVHPSTCETTPATAPFVPTNRVSSTNIVRENNGPSSRELPVQVPRVQMPTSQYNTFMQYNVLTQHNTPMQYQAFRQPSTSMEQNSLMRLQKNQYAQHVPNTPQGTVPCTVPNCVCHAQTWKTTAQETWMQKIQKQNWPNVPTNIPYNNNNPLPYAASNLAQIKPQNVQQSVPTSGTKRRKSQKNNVLKKALLGRQNVRQGIVNPPPLRQQNIHQGLVDPPPLQQQNIHQRIVDPSSLRQQNIHQGIVDPSPLRQQSIHQEIVNPPQNAPLNLSDTVRQISISRNVPNISQNITSVVSTSNCVRTNLPKTTEPIQTRSQQNQIFFHLNTLTDIQKIILCKNLDSYFHIVVTEQWRQTYKDETVFKEERNLLHFLHITLTNYLNKIITSDSTKIPFNKNSKNSKSQNIAILPYQNINNNNEQLRAPTKNLILALLSKRDIFSLNEKKSYTKDPSPSTSVSENTAINEPSSKHVGQNLEKNSSTSISENTAINKLSSGHVEQNLEKNSSTLENNESLLDTKKTSDSVKIPDTHIDISMENEEDSIVEIFCSKELDKKDSEKSDTTQIKDTLKPKDSREEQQSEPLCLVSNTLNSLKENHTNETNERLNASQNDINVENNYSVRTEKARESSVAVQNDNKRDHMILHALVSKTKHQNNNIADLNSKDKAQESEKNCTKMQVNEICKLHDSTVSNTELLSYLQLCTTKKDAFEKTLPTYNVLYNEYISSTILTEFNLKVEQDDFLNEETENNLVIKEKNETNDSSNLQKPAEIEETKINLLKEQSDSELITKEEVLDELNVSEEIANETTDRESAEIKNKLCIDIDLLENNSISSQSSIKKEQNAVKLNIETLELRTKETQGLKNSQFVFEEEAENTIEFIDVGEQHKDTDLQNAVKLNIETLELRTKETQGLKNSQFVFEEEAENTIEFIDVGEQHKDTDLQNAVELNTESLELRTEETQGLKQGLKNSQFVFEEEAENTIELIDVIEQLKDSDVELDVEPVTMELSTHNNVKTINKQLTYLMKPEICRKAQSLSTFAKKTNRTIIADTKENIFIENKSNDDIVKCDFVKTEDLLITSCILSNIKIENVRSLSSLEKKDNVDIISQGSPNINDNSEILNENKACLRCRRRSKVYCENCLQAHYCSKRCSDLHWKTSHYKNCKPHNNIIINE